jgi:tripartite-type tricarboxylate transporter receptor subunit TctC
MVGGTVSAVMVPLSDLLEFASAGKCRILAVTGEQRSRFAPNVPTFHEMGLGEYGMRTWIGVFLPAGTPAPLVQKLGATMKSALADKAIVAAIEGTAQEVMWSTPEETRAKMNAERLKWTQAVKALNFTPES